MALLAPVVGFAMATFVGAAFVPVLLVHSPLGLIALNPAYPHLVLVSNRLETLPFFAVAALRLFAADPFYFLIGREYGESAVEWIERRSGFAGRMTRGIERLFARAGPAVLFLIPGGVVCVLAGASRMRVRTFLVTNLAGTTTALTLIRVFGHAFADPIELLRDFVQANLLVLTVLSVILVATSTIVRRRRARHRRGQSSIVETRNPR